MVNRSFADMRRTPVSPAPCRAFFRRIRVDFPGGFRVLHCEFTCVTDHGRLSFIVQVMTWLIIFLGVWPIALGLLLRFAVRIDPRSGRWRRR